MIVKNADDLRQAAIAFLKKFPIPGPFAFFGDMGAGKTTFIKAICAEMKVPDTVTSPSFALVNEYQTPEGNMVYHCDFYRIKSINEVYDLGYEEYFYGMSYCFIEWPEKIKELLPEKVVKIKIWVLADGSRKIALGEKS